jgi:hypothetical protein
MIGKYRFLIEENPVNYLTFFGKKPLFPIGIGKLITLWYCMYTWFMIMSNHLPLMLKIQSEIFFRIGKYGPQGNSKKREHLCHFGTICGIQVHPPTFLSVLIA